MSSGTQAWLLAAATSAFALTLSQIFRWPLTDLLTPFIEPFVEIAAGLLFLVIGIGSLVHALRQRKVPGHSAWLPFCLFACAFVIIPFVPFDQIYLKANFYLYKSDRTAVAQSILAGPEGQRENQGGRGNFVSLPTGMKDLSAGGEVTVDHRDGKTYILFLTYRGILDRFSGYVYSPTDDPPAKNEFLGDGVEIERVAPHWFWYAS